MERLATDGTLATFGDEIPKDLREVFVCAHDVSPEWHMRMQAAFQRHCDSSISKTINFSESAKVEDVAKIYRLAYEMDCKGVTVYRNGCRQHQPMALKSDGGHDKVADAAKTAAHQPLKPAVLPEILSAIRIRQLTPFGNMHVNITVDPQADRELEVFAQLGKGGDIANSDLEAICRMISLWLRAGGTLNLVVRQLQSIGSSLQVHTKEGKIMSLGDGLSRALRKYMQAKSRVGLRALLTGDPTVDEVGAESRLGFNGHGNGNGNGSGSSLRRVNGIGKPAASVAVVSEPARIAAPIQLDGRSMQWQQTQYKVLCPDCQNALRFGEGCVVCEACGYSEC